MNKKLKIGRDSVKEHLDNLQLQTELLLQERTSLYEIIDCICDAISNVQIDGPEEESVEYKNLQFCSEVIASTTYALELDARINSVSARIRGIQAMQNELEQIKKHICTNESNNTAIEKYKKEKTDWESAFFGLVGRTCGLGQADIDKIISDATEENKR